MSTTNANYHHIPGALEELQNAIYREKVLRAQSMTEDQRLSLAFEMTNSVFARMHEGAMWQLGTNDPEVGWQEVRRRLEILARTHDSGRFVTERPSVNED